jgi:NAD(P)-dependent dehydrogenase (short-subunit alcohol dehydrogenase family)
MDLDLKGNVALVTGGSEGIGRATAQAFGREGASVVICARRTDVLEAAAREVAAATGSEIVPVPADVTRTKDVERAVNAAVDRFGRLDILVNNAGISRGLPFDEATDEVWQEDLDLKLFAAVRTCRLAIPHMRKAGGGSIVNILNTGARVPAAASVPTSVSRAAGLALTKALSKEFAADGIRVNGVLIGYVKTSMHVRTWEAHGGDESLEEYYDRNAKLRGIPLGRVGEAAEVGDLIAFLCSARAAYITGTAIAFDGGSSPVI